jgi:hypothetical protein
VLIFMIFNLLAGLAFAWLARDRIRVDGPFAPPAFLYVALHAGIIVAPIALYFYLVHPEWAWMYTLDPLKLSGLAVLPIVVGHTALVGGGWYLAAFLIRTDRKKFVLYAMGGVALVFLVMVAVTWTRLSHAAASTQAFHLGSGGRVGLFDIELGYAVVVALLAIAGSAVYTALGLLRDRRRVRAR